MKFPVVLLCLALPALADDPRGDNPDAPASTAQEQLKMFKVPPGFEVQLVADESQIQKPMNLNFDAAGRLWVTGSELYPWPAKLDALGQPIENFDAVWAKTSGSFDAKKAPPPPEHAIDTVRVLSDFAPDGRARKVEVFADGLNIPIGVQPLPRKPGAKGDTVLVYSIPAIWHLEDTDGDGRADKREPLYTGFDFRDTHGMSSNYYYWIDGWIYGCHGFANQSEVKDRNGKVTSFHSGNTYRFRPDGSQIEYWSHGQTNPFGLCFDEMGNLYSADSHSKPVMLVLRGGYYEGIGKQHDGLGFAPRITDDDHGSSSIAGIAYYADDKWPAEFRGNLFNGNPVTRRINRARLDWHGSSPRATRLEDFVTCDDPWFRPVQVKLGPDGALWIADFYNPIIGHYEAPLADPRRDHTHGRIWRVVYRDGEAVAPGSTGGPPVAPGGPPGASNVSSAAISEKANAPARPDVAGGPPATTGQRPVLPIPAPPDLTALDAAGLVEKLADPNLIVRTLATHEIVERIDPLETLRAFRTWTEQNRELLYSIKRSAEQKRTLLARQLGFMVWIGERFRQAGGTTESVAWDLQTLSGAGGALSNDELDVQTARLKSERSDLLWLKFLSDGLRFDNTPALEKRAIAQSVSMGAETLADPALGAKDREAASSPFLTSLRGLLVCWDYTSPADTQLIYALRIALRECLRESSAYRSLADLAQFNSRVSEHIVEVSLAVPTKDSAEFLLTHLRRTKFSTPRAGEYLKHAALHLPTEKFGEVASLTNELNDAPLEQKLALAEGLGTASRERKLPLPDDATAWVQRVILDALANDDADVQDRAIAAVRDEKAPEKAEPLRAIVLRAGHGPRRAAALEALMNLPDGVPTAAQAVADPSSNTLRKKAAEVLGNAGGGEARAALLAGLPTAPQELAGLIAAGLAKSPDGAASLLQAIEEGRAAAALLRQKAVADALAKSIAGELYLEMRAAVLTADLPPEDARLDGVIAQRAETYRTAVAGVTDPGHKKPDTAHGAQVFQQNCAVCHRFRNEGGNVGPNLDGMAARGAQRLIEDILDPNRNVDPVFRQTLVETNDGQAFAGANVREQGETLTITDVTGKDVTVPKGSIKARTQMQLSLMPPAFEALIPAGDFNDLLAFLLEPAK